MSKRCPYKDNLSEEGFCRKASYYCTYEQESRCEIKEKATKITNADKIRSMNDIELSKILFSRITEHINCSKDKCNANCNECALKWLQSEVTE